VFSLQYERTVNRDNTVTLQNLVLQIERVSWRATLAGCNVIVHQHLDGTLEYQLRAAPAGTIQPARRTAAASDSGGGKDAHRFDYGYLSGKRKPKNRTSHLLPKADILSC